jgi:calcineurin-like phosphoesterase family protein
MRLILISDTHGKHKVFTDEINELITPDSVLIHCGDFTVTGKEREVRKFNGWIGDIDLPTERKLVCAGNHELTFDRHDGGRYKSMLSRCTYLEDESVNIDGFQFYLSPWSPYFCDWAFGYFPDRAELVWDRVPDDTDILISHGPPKYILDRCDNGNVGCDVLGYHVAERVRPLIHAFGHIHEGYGQVKVGNTHYINASLLDGSYDPINKPIVVEI